MRHTFLPCHFQYSKRMWMSLTMSLNKYKSQTIAPRLFHVTHNSSPFCFSQKIYLFVTCADEKPRLLISLIEIFWQNRNHLHTYKYLVNTAIFVLFPWARALGRAEAPALANVTSSSICLPSAGLWLEVTHTRDSLWQSHTQSVELLSSGVICLTYSCSFVLSRPSVLDVCAFSGW